MITYKCLKGHESTEPDFCSECGNKILGISVPLVEKTVSPTLTAKITETCPDCGAPHEANSGNFCEICGYNFITGGHGELAIAKLPQAANDNTVRQNTNNSNSTSSVVSWEILVTIDPSLCHPDSPEPPSDQPPITFRLDKPVNLIGRNSQSRAIHPDIALDFDSAVSHRHALLTLETDNTLTLRDIGSSNGTQLKAVELKPMVDIKLQDGDEFTLGHWTRIVVKAVH